MTRDGDFQVSEVYRKVHGIMSNPAVQSYVPSSWVSLVQVKKEHYRALAHFFVAVGLLENAHAHFSPKTMETLQFLHEEAEDKAATLIEIRVPKDQGERKYLGEGYIYIYISHSKQFFAYFCQILHNLSRLVACLPPATFCIMDIRIIHLSMII